MGWIIPYQKKDLPIVDPLNVPDAETIISASHRMHGEWYGNYEELRFKPEDIERIKPAMSGRPKDWLGWQDSNLRMAGSKPVKTS